MQVIIIKIKDLSKRDEQHIMICEKYKYNVVKNKKGKGSYNRKSKYKSIY